MTDPGPIRSARRFLESFIEAGPTTWGDPPTTAYPVGASSRRTISANLIPDAPTENPEHAQGTASLLNDAIPMQRTGQGSWEGYLIPSGVIGTDPDLVTDFESGGWRKVSGGNAAVAAGTSTTSRVDLNLSTNWAIGQAAYSALLGEVRIVTAVDSLGTDIVVDPPFSSAPTSGAILCGVAFWTNDSRDDAEDNATLWVAINRFLKRGTGYVPDSFGFQFGGNRTARMNHSGPCRQVEMLGWTTMNDVGGIDNVVTSMTVTDPDKVPDDVSAANPYHFQIIDSVNGNENIEVTAKAGAVLTMVRNSPAGAGAVLHPDGATIVPYTATGVYAGSPVPATAGHFRIGGTLIKANTVDVNAALSLATRDNCHGDGYAFGGYMQDTKEVTWDVKGWSDAATMAIVHDTIARGTPSMFMQQNTTQGSIVGAYSPNCLLKVPEANPSDAQEISISLSGPARGNSGQDECCIFFC